MNEFTFRLGDHAVRGVSAEVLSFLKSDGSLTRRLLGEASPELIVSALDTTVSADERVPLAIEALESIRRTVRIGRWLPFHSGLANLEFANFFASDHYSGYRDHTIHSLHLYLLGWYVYLRCDRIRSALSAYLTTRSTDEGALSPEDLFAEWWGVTSIWHDWGYPFESSLFVTDGASRRQVLERLSSSLGDAPFDVALSHHLKKPIGDQDRQKLYGHGGFYRWRLNSVGHLLSGHRGCVTTNRMWERFGATPISGDVVQTLIRLTTTEPQGRPAYYDHGLLGGLLLGAWWKEVESFTTRLAREVDTREILPLDQATREEAAWEVIRFDGLIDCITESISFHNLNVHDWPVDVLSQIWNDPTLLPKPGIDEEPHLFFLCLCDTLQDWDRHRFLPQFKRRAIPSLRSSDILLQANHSHISISLPPNKSISEIRSLFSNWLCDSDINSLISHSPSFSVPELIVDGGAAPSLATSQASKRELDVVIAKIQRVVDAVGAIVLGREEGTLGQSIAMLQDIWTTIDEKRRELIERDDEELSSSQAWQHLVALQAFVVSRVGEGEAVPRGTIARMLGEGGFGKVYLVQPDNANSGTDVAYKVFHQADLQNPEKRRLFRRGFEAMRRLWQCRGVVPVFEYTDFPVGFYMEFVAGHDLEKDLPAAGSVHDRVQMLAEIADTLVIAHKNGVYHRDIKPANVILNPRDNHFPILTDFDLAWITGKSTATKISYATVRFGAPEQFEERLAAYRTKPTVDVFSFGALMYYVFSSENPPVNASFTENNWNILQERIHGNLLHSAVDDIVSLTKKCVQFHPADRPQSMDEVLRVLKRIRFVGTDGTLIINIADFLREIVGEYGSTEDGTDMVPSTTGRSTWATRALSGSDGGKSNLKLECALVGSPAREGVDCQEYRRNASKQIDQALARWRPEELLGGARVERRRGTGNEWLLIIHDVKRTRKSAKVIGGLMSEISRIIE